MAVGLSNAEAYGKPSTSPLSIDGMTPSKNVKVGATDGAGRDLDDCIATILDPRIGDALAADVARAVPRQRFQNSVRYDAHPSMMNLFPRAERNDKIRYVPSLCVGRFRSQQLQSEQLNFVDAQEAGELTPSSR
jgi:hypothetical protein